MSEVGKTIVKAFVTNHKIIVARSNCAIRLKRIKDLQKFIDWTQRLADQKELNHE